MDLIEKLGGYESAKDKLSRMSSRDRCCFEDKLEFFSFAGLQKALLEYRREHGIFDVGDWVVIGEFRVLAQFTGYVHKDTHAELPQISVDGVLYSSHFGAWKHATDEEIKAGRRL